MVAASTLKNAALGVGHHLFAAGSNLLRSRLDVAHYGTQLRDGTIRRIDQHPGLVGLADIDRSRQVALGKRIRSSLYRWGWM